jgi:hypothetical protein
MLKVIRLKELIMDSKHVVSYRTEQGHRVDISKKFIVKTANGEFTIFTKNKKDKVAGFILQENEIYIVEVSNDNLAREASSKPIVMIKDLLPYSHINRYVETMDVLENLLVKPW